MDANGPLGRPTAVRAAGGRAGFSLYELLFVLVIVGIITGMMTPLFSPGRWRADNAVQELALSLAAAQRLAVLRQHDVVVTFDVDDRAYTILEDNDNDGEQDDGENYRLVQLPETIGFDRGAAPALPEGGAAITFAPQTGDPVLTFHRNGSASTSGAIYLRPVEGSLASSTEAVRALTIERATGEVRCYSYRTGSWEESC